MSEAEKVSGTRNIKQMAPDLEEMNKVIFDLIHKFQKISDGAYLSGAYAEWHIKGLAYHAERMIAAYTGIVEALKIRLESVPDGEVFIMHTPEINHFMFEFYAFINLARITLNNLTHILYPLFTNNSRQLPKSVTELEQGFTNCPVFERIAATEELRYMIDLRNCIVHYRTFATSNNSVVTKEGFDYDFEAHSGNKWTVPMAKAVFRITEANNLVFNIYLPDTIYDNTGQTKKLSKFSYQKRINILGESMRFLHHIGLNYVEALTLNLQSQEKRFEFKKNGDFKTEFKKVVF